MHNHHAPTPYRLIIQPDDGIEPVLELIRSARLSLRIKQFSLTDPRILTALVDAHTRKVLVRIMLNPTRPDGTRDNDETFTQLERLGIPVQWSNPHYTVTHEKSIVADDLQALIATFNLCPKYFSETRDYGIITTDLEQIADIRDCFECDWERKTFSPDETGLAWSDANSRLKMARLIDSSKHRLDVQHPKYVDLAILDRLVEAHTRGVRLRILCAGTHGVRAWDRVETFASLRLLQKLGVPVHRLHHPKLHAKLILADGKSIFTGSMNIHHRAFDERRELGVTIDDQAIVLRLEKQFHLDWESSSKFEVPDPMLFDQHEEHGDVGD